MATRLGSPFATELGAIPFTGGNPPVITPVDLGTHAPGCVNFSLDIPVTNSPVTWSIVAGALPVGYDVGEGAGGPSTGAVFGTSTVPGLYTFTIRAENDDGFDDWATSMTIAAFTAPGIDTTPPTSPVATGDFYDFQFLSTTDFDLSCSVWTVVAGALPTGIDIVFTFIEGCEIAGTPTTPGTFNFTLRSENGAGFDEQSFTIVVTGSGDGTATPASIDLVATVPAPTASGSSPGTASPAAVARAAVVPASTASGSSSTTPTAVALAATVPAPSVFARPANDNFADAIALSNGVKVTKSRDDATAEGGETGTATLWWKFTTTDAGPVSVNTIGSTYDTVLRVYTGASIGTLSLIASDDDSGGSFTSLLSFAGAAATTYYVQVSNGAFSFIGSSITVQATWPISAVTLAVVVPAPTVTGGASGDGFAFPAAIARTVVVPAPTASGTTPNGTAFPAAITLAATVPAPTATGGVNGAATPAAIALHATVPAPTATGTIGAVLAATWGPMTGVTVASVSARIEAVLAATW